MQTTNSSEEYTPIEQAVRAFRASRPQRPRPTPCEFWRVRIEVWRGGCVVEAFEVTESGTDRRQATMNVSDNLYPFTPKGARLAYKAVCRARCVIPTGGAGLPELPGITWRELAEVRKEDSIGSQD